MLKGECMKVMRIIGFLGIFLLSHVQPADFRENEGVEVKTVKLKHLQSGLYLRSQRNKPLFRLGEEGQAQVFEMIDVTPAGLAGGRRFHIKLADMFLRYSKQKKSYVLSKKPQVWSAPAALPPQYAEHERRLTPQDDRGSLTKDPLLQYDEVTLINY